MPSRVGAGAVPTYLGIALATILAGLALRLVPLGLPHALVKWGGSVLWAAMVYWLAAAFAPHRRAWFVALAAGVIATLVELLRLFHTPGLDAFRLTLTGILLLGRVFSAWHILAYWLVIVAMAGLDMKLFRRALPERP